MMNSIEQNFLSSISRIPRHGLGLSVDVYTPDLFELTGALDREDLPYDYLEIFKASQPALAVVRGRLPATRLTYHGEGLWLTQPEMAHSHQFGRAFSTAASHLATLRSAWINHECATKEMAGYSFGTYLPPLFTNATADITASNVRLIQQRLATSECFADDKEPIVLIEIPPLTYFGAGDLSVEAFFRRIVAQVPCGLVLDIGHVWTVYRYSGQWRERSLGAFLAEFLDRFPLQRVVQIHVAGLDAHQQVTAASDDRSARSSSREALPLWIDAHSAPIPEVVWDMLAQVLSHPGLTNLKGLALEVDTKPVSQTVAEFRRLCERFGDRFDRVRLSTAEPAGAPVITVSDGGTHPETSEHSAFARHDDADDAYVRTLIKADAPSDVIRFFDQDRTGLDLYRRHYLRHEILEWGGNVREMFPRTARQLEARGLSQNSFVDHWFGRPRMGPDEYDFFLLKIERFVEFVGKVLPDSLQIAVQEATHLREAYRQANERIFDDLVFVKE